MKSSPGEGSYVRAIGLPMAVILVISSIIGSGVYKKVAPMSESLQSPNYVLLAWALAGLVTLMGGLSTAEIGGVITESGGPYAYFKRIYGKAFAFFYGWTSFSVIQSASIASIAYVFAQSVNAIWPLPHLDAAWESWTFLWIFTPFANIGVKLLAVGLILSLALVNARGVLYGGWLSNIITISVLIGIFTVIILGLSMSNGSVENLTTVATSYPPESFKESSFISVFFLAMLSAFWGYEGWLNLGFIGEEVKNPQRNIPLSLTLGLLAIITIYLLVNATYLYVVPMDKMLEIAADPNAIAAVEVMKSFLGNGGMLFISVLIIISTLGCTNTTILTAARIYQTMAKNGLFFKRAAHLHPRFNTPHVALLSQGIWASLLVFSGTFDQLTDMLIFASFIFYGAIVFGVFVLRRKEPDTPRPYRVIGYPVVPALFVLFCIVLVGNTIIELPRESGMGLLLIATGIPFYLMWYKRFKA